MPATWVCLLRGVNVGGVVLKMEDFRLAGPGAGGLSGRLLYGAYPSGYGKSKYSNNYLEKYFSVMATTRNLNTMERLLALAQDPRAAI